MDVPRNFRVNRHVGFSDSQKIRRPPPVEPDFASRDDSQGGEAVDPRGTCRGDGDNPTGLGQWGLGKRNDTDDTHWGVDRSSLVVGPTGQGPVVAQKLGQPDHERNGYRFFNKFVAAFRTSEKTAVFHQAAMGTGLTVFKRNLAERAVDLHNRKPQLTSPPTRKAKG